MKSFKDIISRKFPNDSRLGFYVKPNLPATKVGRALNDYTRIKGPGDVLGFFEYGNLFSGGTIVVTDTECFYSKGSFALEDVKGAVAKENTVEVGVNQSGNLTTHILKAGNP
ncbi:MAG: hypothetical protein NZ108_08710, partial [Bacteroidia bacterium]|nr:hypothetical protein [Bacteroidia bacterium]